MSSVRANSTEIASTSMGRHLPDYSASDGNGCAGWTALTYNTGGLPAVSDARGLTITPAGPQSQLCKDAQAR